MNSASRIGQGPRLPRLRLALAVCGSTVVSFITDLRALAFVLVAGLLVAAIAVLAGASARALGRRILTVNLFVALLWLTVPWQLSASGLTLADEGLALAQQISLRTNAIALLSLGLLAGMDAFVLARAAAGLGLPCKLARLLALTVRYFGLLQDCRRRIERAMRARAFRPGFNLRTVAVTAQLVALLLVNAMQRAERVGLAMRARGFAPGSPAAGQSALRPLARRPAFGVTVAVASAALGLAWLSTDGWMTWIP